MRNILVAVLFWIVSCASTEVDAQQFAGGVFNPSNGTFQIRMQDGTLVVADRVTERIFITDRTGQMAEMTFEQAAATYEPDPAKRAALLSSLRSSMRDPQMGGALAFPVDPYRNEPNPCPDNGGLPGGGETECNIGQGQPGFISTMSDDGDSLPKPTDLDTMTVTGMRPEVLTHSGGAALYYSGSLGNYSNPGGSSNTATLLC